MRKSEEQKKNGLKNVSKIYLENTWKNNFNIISYHIMIDLGALQAVMPIIIQHLLSDDDNRL